MFKLDRDSIKKTVSGQFTGRIHIVVGENHFPEENWNDFIPQVLNWWCIELDPFLRGYSTKASLRFMDGPFEATLADDGVSTTIQYMSNGKVLKVFKVNSMEIKREAYVNVLNIIEICLEAIKQLGLENPESLELKQHYLSLKALAGNFNAL